MSARTFYRLSLWIPLAVPAAVVTAVHGFGMRAPEGPVATFVQVMLISAVYGGLPYALLALWGTWWIDRRSEPEIRRRALLAPLWMIAAWIPFATLPSVLSGKLEMFVGLVALGAVYALGLGYLYVGLILGLRALFGRAGLISPA